MPFVVHFGGGGGGAGSVGQVQELHRLALRLGGWGTGAGTIRSDVYKVRRAATRELCGQMESHLGWEQEHHLANVFSFSRHKKIENLPVVLGRVALTAYV